MGGIGSGECPSQHLPTVKFEKIFLSRHNLFYRRFMLLIEVRAILTVVYLREWHELTQRALRDNPVLFKFM